MNHLAFWNMGPLKESLGNTANYVCANYDQIFGHFVFLIKSHSPTQKGHSWCREYILLAGRSQVQSSNEYALSSC